MTRATDDAAVPDGIDRRDGVTAVTRNELLTQLVGLLPAKFDEVLLRAQIPVHCLSAGGAQATRATEAIRHAEQQRNFDDLARIVADVAAAVATPLPVSRPTRAGAPLAVAAVTGAAALGLLLIMLRDAQTLVGLGLTSTCGTCCCCCSGSRPRSPCSRCSSRTLATPARRSAGYSSLVAPW